MRTATLSGPSRPDRHRDIYHRIALFLYQNHRRGVVVTGQWRIEQLFSLPEGWLARGDRMARVDEVVRHIYNMAVEINRKPGGATYRLVNRMTEPLLKLELARARKVHTVARRGLAGAQGRSRAAASMRQHFAAILDESEVMIDKLVVELDRMAG